LFDLYGDLENYLGDELKSPFLYQYVIDEDECEDVNWFRNDVPRTTIDTRTG